MTAFILVLVAATVLVIFWVTLIRPWLRDKSWMRWFFETVEPIELWLYNKSESILWARWQQFLGVVLVITGLFDGIDYSALAFFTPDWIDPLLPVIPAILNITGTIAERLRRDTTKPLEVVSLPIDKSPDVSAAVAKLEETKLETVAVIKEETKVP